MRQRSHAYVRCAFAVSRDPHAAGMEALFDHALNNGLAVIVSTAWPGAELEVRRNGGAEPRVKAASGLLDVLVEKAGSPGSSVTASGTDLADGQVRVLSIASAPETIPATVTLTVSNLPEGQPPPQLFLPIGAEHDSGVDVVRIEVATLREAIRIVHRVRHGRARQGELERHHVDALVALDGHSELRGLLDAEIDADYVRDKAQDLWLRDNATRYLALLDEEEIQRRVEAADYCGSSSGGYETLQECPVCGNETLVAESIDDFGIGIGAGTCFVCGYWRSPREVDEAAQDIRLEYVLRDD